MHDDRTAHYQDAEHTIAPDRERVSESSPAQYAPATEAPPRVTQPSPRR
jgi:hypothetical protein